MFSRPQLIDTAQASPRAVAAHDREAWLGLFAEDAEVHDPVGSAPHAGRAALERFYATFIAPNDIRFEVHRDIVCGQTVVRDVNIVTRMGGTPLTVSVPLFIRYEIVDEAGHPRIRRLYAHWELLPMMRQQVFAQGLGPGLVAMLRLSRNMLTHQGLGGALGFSRALGGAGRREKRSAEQFLLALASGDDMKASLLMAPNARVQLGLKEIGLADLCQRLRGLTWRKLLAGGQQVTVALSAPDGHAVAVFDFGDPTHRFTNLRIYRDDAT